MIRENWFKCFGTWWLTVALLCAGTTASYGGPDGEPAPGSCPWYSLAPLGGEFAVDDKLRVRLKLHQDAPGLKPLDFLLGKLGHHLLGVDAFENAVRHAAADNSSAPMPAKLLDGFNVKVRVGPDAPDSGNAAESGTGEVDPFAVRGQSVQLENFPKEGATVVVMNHPHMGYEALAMIKAIQDKRQDVRIFLLDESVASLPGLREWGFVKNYGKDGTPQVGQATKDARKWVADGHALIVFPSGKLSFRDKGKEFSRDKDWEKGAAWIAQGALKKQDQVHLVPVYVEGQPTQRWQWIRRNMGLQAAGIAMIPEFKNRAGMELNLAVGNPISTASLPKDVVDATKYVEAVTHAHARNHVPGQQISEPAPRTMEPLAEPRSVEKMVAEVAKLEAAGRLLAEKQGLQAFEANASDIPELLQEIGRLRELTFRQVNEGSGKAQDLDSFDQYYRHLFLWDPEAQKLVGAYRMGLGDEIMAERGVEGFYNGTLFDMKPYLEREGSQYIEMGRTFIRPEYQGHRAGLFLLWRGIGEFIARNQQYKGFFGPVSMSSDYSRTSSQLLVDHTMRNYGHPEANVIAKPLNSVQPVTPLTEQDLEAINTQTDLRDLSRLISSIEPDGKPMPPLYRSYQQFNAKYLTWSYDPGFNSFDGLIHVDMTEAPMSAIKKYLGEDKVTEWLGRHKPPKEEGSD